MGFAAAAILPPRPPLVANLLIPQERCQTGFVEVELQVGRVTFLTDMIYPMPWSWTDGVRARCVDPAGDLPPSAWVSADD